MSGETSDTSQFCKLEWFEWVMLQDETSPFLDDVLKLGHYLGPSIDISLPMMIKILTENGQVLYRLTYQPLTPDELLDKDGSDAQEQFMVRVYGRWGSKVLPRELEDIGQENSPQDDSYENETQNKLMFPQLAEELEPMPELGGH